MYLTVGIGSEYYIVLRRLNAEHNGKFLARKRASLIGNSNNFQVIEIHHHVAHQVFSAVERSIVNHNHLKCRRILLPHYHWQILVEPLLIVVGKNNNRHCGQVIGMKIATSALLPFHELQQFHAAAVIPHNPQQRQY